MAAIREILTLEDKFSAAFSKYISLGTDAAASTKAVKDAAQRATAASKIQAAAMNAAAASAKAQTAALRLQHEQQKEAASSAEELTGKIKGMIGAYVGMQSVQAVVGLSDTLTQTTARLDLMKGDIKDVAQLQEMIADAADRSRGAYQGTADMVAKLGMLAGDAFNSSAEIVSFAEQINKQMVLSGASTQAADAAMLQLTQALSAGALRGEELNSILEQAPTIAQAIAEYMGVTTGEMREMASEGQITAEVVKNAMFDAAEETNKAFESMPMTWAQVWTQFKNTAIKAFDPVLTAINWTANHLDIIAPIVLGIAGAFTVFMIATKGAAAATAIMTIAQQGLNAVMMMNPIGLIIMAVVLLISIFYAVIAVINEVTGSSISATGIIAGVFATAGGLILNTFVVPVQNGVAALANFIGNVFNDPVTAVKVLFYDMALAVLDRIRSLVGGIEDLINAIPGVKVSLTSSVENLYNTLKANREAAISSGSYTEYVKRMEYVDLGGAFSAGYNWGSNLFSGSNSISSNALPSAVSYDSIAVAGNDEEEKKTLNGISKDVGSIEKAVNLSQEDLQSLVELAERQYVNNINLTAQTPVINITGANTGRTAADRQDLADAIRDILIEQVAAGSVRSTSSAY